MSEFAIPIEKASETKDGVLAELQKFGAAKKVRLADARLVVANGLAAEAFNGNIKGAALDYSADIGVRVFAGRTIAGGFAGKQLGSGEMGDIKKELHSLLGVAFKRAKLNSVAKEKEMRILKTREKGLYSTGLAEVPVIKDVWQKQFRQNPLNAGIDDFVKRAEGLSKEISKIRGISANAIGIASGLERKVFASSEGSLIEQTRAITEPSVYVAASGRAQETFHEWIAEAKGTEALEGDNSHGKSLEDFARYLAQGTVELSNSPTAKFNPNATIVTDQWFNTLLSHEICGHPLEADRALKRETAWAGRAWWYRSTDDNELGRTVGSEEMGITSNPELEGSGTYGNYKYDDEGVLGKKVRNIEKGVLRELMNSRETSQILEAEPNGHMRATSASFMPLIRMSNTYFEAGSWKAQELIEDTRDGYYIVGEKTPSIGESRQNFNITCWKCFKISGGELGQLYRSAGIEYDSREMFMSIEAADDVKHFNVPNCGKGTPMQTMRLGNGGPHLRLKANLTGGHS